jgi:hypothetical protein
MMPQSYKALPPLELLQELFWYDASAGQLRWRARLSNRVKIGSVAGTRRDDGYYKIRIHGVFYYSHRIIWYMHTGEDPGEAQIDHIDGDKSNGRIENLRLASNGQNMSNVGPRSNNTSGHLGVTWDTSKGLWKAAIGKNGKTIHLGRFRSAEDAAAARRLGELRYHQDFAAHLCAHRNA